MKQVLDNLKKEVSSFKTPKPLSDSDWKHFADNTIVALMAGGTGTRFQEVSKDKDVNKASYELPNGDTMIEMSIRMYRDAGIKNFVALVFHGAKSIEELLGDGSSLGVNITYSYDPEKLVGKGGAVLNALMNGSIPRNKSLIVDHPDDVIVNYPGSFPRDIAAGHLQGVSEGKIGTVVVVEETPYAFTGMEIKDSEITQIEMYPMIPIPTHVGITVFSPEVYPYFERLFDLTKRNDFEKVLFPVLAEEHKLYATSIPTDSWIAVNNAKAFKQLVELVEAGN